MKNYDKVLLGDHMEQKDVRLYVIPVKKKCNASCSFCYMKDKKDNGLQEYLSVDKLNNLLLKNNLDRITSIELTGGGEPTLHPEIQTIINLLKNKLPKAKIKMYTNGIKPINIVGINELNISRVHWDSTINNPIMGYKNGADLGDVLSHYRSLVDKIRTQTILLKGVIDSEAKALEFISKYETLVDVFMFRTLFTKCNRDKEKFVEFSINHPKVKIDKTLDNYERDLLFINSNCDVFNTFQYE